MVVLPTPPLSAPTRMTDGFILCPAPCAGVVEASGSRASSALLDEWGFGSFNGFASWSDTVTPVARSCAADYKKRTELSLHRYSADNSDPSFPDR
jgi:hypothetical protein